MLALSLRLHHAFFLALRTEYRVRSGCLVLGSLFWCEISRRLDWLDGLHHPTLKAAPAALTSSVHTRLLAREYILHSQPAPGRTRPSFHTSYHTTTSSCQPASYPAATPSRLDPRSASPLDHIRPSRLHVKQESVVVRSVNTNPISSRPLLAYRLWTERRTITQVCLRHIPATLATRGLKLHYQIRRLLSSTRRLRVAPAVTPPRLLPRPSTITVVTRTRRGQRRFQIIFSIAHTTSQVLEAPVWRSHNQQVRPCLCKMDATIKTPSQTTSKSNLTMMYP